MAVWVGVIFLAVLQGLTEFLPVSSSGHLVIAKNLLGLDAPGVRLELLLHVGTLFAVLMYFRKLLWNLLSGVCRRDAAAWRMVLLLAVATVPAGLAGVLLKITGATALLANPRLAGFGLLVTGAGLISLRFVRNGERDVTWLRALLMGIGQAVAVLPGISRSGTTVLVARYAGVTRVAAAEFAMLMSIPVILGAALLDATGGADLSGGAAGSVTPAMYAAGMVVAAAVGYAAIGIFMRVIKSGAFWLFGVYCLFAGSVALAAQCMAGK